MAVLELTFRNVSLKSGLKFDPATSVRSCGTSFFTQSSWALHFQPDKNLLCEMFCTTAVLVSKGHLGGASP